MSTKINENMILSPSTRIEIPQNAKMNDFSCKTCVKRAFYC